MIGRIEASSYQLGTINVNLDQCIVYTNLHSAYSNYSKKILLMASIFGREEEIKAISAAILEDYNTEIFIGDNHLNNCSRESGYKYSTVSNRLITSNNQRFLHRIIYAKQTFENGALLIAKTKEEMKLKLWQIIERQLKDTPIPSFARDAVWGEVTKDDRLFYASDDAKSRLFKFGLGNRVITYNNIYDNIDVKDIIKQKREELNV